MSPGEPSGDGGRTSDIPDVCFVEDLVRILRASRATIDRRLRGGSFPIPELPALDNRRRWSGAAVRRFIETGQTGRALLRR